MKIIGILAKKLNHSLSPDIHKYWSKKTRSNFSYRKFELSKHKLNNFFSNFRRNNKFKGFNITIPHKEQCLDLCDKVSSRARKIGAVNLIFKKNKLIYGDNTDVIGFSKCFYSLKNGTNMRSAKYFRVINEIPTIILILVIFIVIFKPI